eukprot:snap_masked-scaffold_4-processed-gene-21.61-mRNA-1 protein AED:1.00 eAED:1.00 QI:0/0/0/0/1/1/3/0/264
MKQIFGSREGISEKYMLKLKFGDLLGTENLKLEDKMLFPKDSKFTNMKEDEFIFEYEFKAEFDSGASITMARVDSFGIPKQILKKFIIIEARGIRDASNSIVITNDYVCVKRRIGVKNTPLWITAPEVKIWIVDKPQWSKLLIGKDDIYLLELMPGQILFNRIHKEVDLQRNDVKLIKSIGKDIVEIRNKVILQIKIAKNMKNVMKKISSGDQEMFSEGNLRFMKHKKGVWKVETGELSGEVTIQLLGSCLVQWDASKGLECIC